MIIDCVVSDWRKTWRKKEQKTQVVLLFVVVFVCVFYWLMTVCFCDWCCLLIVDGFDRQTEMSKCCVCCVLMVFFVSLFFSFCEMNWWILWKMEKKVGRKSKKVIDCNKRCFLFFVVELIDWFFFFEMDWKEGIFWLFLIYE